MAAILIGQLIDAHVEVMTASFRPICPSQWRESRVSHVVGESNTNTCPHPAKRNQTDSSPAASPCNSFQSQLERMTSHEQNYILRRVYPLLGNGAVNMPRQQYRLCFLGGLCRGVIK
jgi:hypothetical protein